MVTHFDHITIVVRDLDGAACSGLNTIARSSSRAMSFPNTWGYPASAEHVTLVLTGAVPRAEVQLLAYRAPDPEPNPHIEHLNTVGFCAVRKGSQ